ncbi:MAG: FtsX-like permease family protein [Pseudomonadota bacterium]
MTDAPAPMPAPLPTEAPESAARSADRPRAPRRASVAVIALRDLAHDWILTLVAVTGFTVALAPLLILFGLKLGVVDTLRAELASDPANLELTMQGGGNHRFDAAWFEALAARPETGFLLPMTRGTVAHMILRNRADRDAAPIEVALLPTGPGDPVLARAGLAPPGAAPRAEGIVLTANAASALGIAAGQPVEALVRRMDADRREAEFLDLTVSGVLPLAVEGSQRMVAYVPLPLIVAVEDYREWQRVERYGWPGRAPLDDPFADFRLYAADLDAVEPLRAHLRGIGIAVTSEAERIARVRRIDRDLSLMFAAILALTLAGVATTIALNQLAAVERKRQTIAVLRLLGYSGRSLMALPVLQASAVALAGSLAALLVFRAMDPVIGALFGDVVAARGPLTRLPAVYVPLILSGSVFLAAVASLFAARRVLRISPSKELRNV